MTAETQFRGRSFVAGRAPGRHVRPQFGDEARSFPTCCCALVCKLLQSLHHPLAEQLYGAKVSLLFRGTG
jgi:hypothetical protein